MSEALHPLSHQRQAPAPHTPPASAALWGLAARLIVLAAAVVVLAWLMATLIRIVLLVVVALMLAAGLGPLARRLQRARLPLSAAVLLIHLGLLLLLALLVVVLLPALLYQLDQVVSAAPAYGNQVASQLQALEQQFPFLLPLEEDLKDQLREVTGQIGVLASQALVVLRFALRLFEALAAALLVLLLTFYFIVDGQRLRGYGLSFLPAASRARVAAVTDRMGERMGGWLLGQIVLSTVVGLASFVGLSLLGVPGAVLLAVLAAIGEAIPIIGPIASAVPAMLVAATVSPVHAGLVAGLYLLIQQMENHLLVPQVMRRAVALHPVAVVLAILTGGTLLGIAGILVAVPITAALAVALDEVRCRGPATSDGGT